MRVGDASLGRGDVLGGRYRIGDEIGRGAHAIVHAATHVVTAQRVAIKVLSASGGSALDRFLLEARATAALQHPNTVRVFDVGREGERVYIAMELLRGRTLAAELAARRARGAAFAEEELVEIADAVLRSLGEAHEVGLVHRDLKPENVFLHRVSADEHAIKVCDFGVVKAADAALTTGGGAVGTPAYMSPEQASGAKVDGRSDLYSLGVILFHLATGELPFRADTPVQVMMLHVTAPPPPLVPLSPLSPRVSAAIARALSKAPEARFSSAAEMREALGATGARRSRLITGVEELPRQVEETRPLVSEGAAPAAALRPRWVLPALVGAVAIAAAAAVGLAARLPAGSSVGLSVGLSAGAPPAPAVVVAPPTAAPEPARVEAPPAPVDRPVPLVRPRPAAQARRQTADKPIHFRPQR